MLHELVILLIRIIKSREWMEHIPRMSEFPDGDNVRVAFDIADILHKAPQIPRDLACVVFIGFENICIDFVTGASDRQKRGRYSHVSIASVDVGLMPPQTII